MTYNLNSDYSQTKTNNNYYNYFEKYNLDNQVIINQKLPLGEKVLPSDIDIFSEIEKTSIKNDEVKNFLNRFRTILSFFSLNNITFPKLQINTVENESTEISWISNYFRVYYNFEKDRTQNSYGMIVSKNDDKYFSSMFDFLNPEKYDEIISKSIEFFISKMNGN